jgi:outer membrane protein TolC
MSLAKKGGARARTAVVLCAALLTLIPAALPAQSAPEPMILSLEDGVRRALENNPDLLVERRNPRIREMEARIERAAFDSTLTAGLTRGETKRPTATTVEAAIFDVVGLRESLLQYDLGLQRNLETGGNLGLTMDVVRSSGLSTVFDPNFNSQLSLTLTQPLLKGFGFAVAETPLNVALNNVRLSLEAFEAKVAGLVETVENSYWDLVAARKDLKVKREAKRAAEAVLSENRERVKLGLMAAIEVLVAEAEVARQEEDVVLAERSVRDAEDRMRQAMNLPPESWLAEQAIVPTTEPETARADVDLRKTVDEALARRPEVRQASLDLENRKMLLNHDQNGLRPGLDFQGSVGMEGLGRSYHDSFDRMGSGDFYNWQLGMVLTVPIGNRAARSAYRKTRMEMEQSAYGLEKTRQNVVMEVKESVRGVRTDFKRIETTRTARQLAEKKLEAETERFKIGLTSTRNLLEFQRDLSAAQSSELAAVVDYNKSLVTLARTRGTLLEDREIHLSRSEIRFDPKRSMD